MNVDKSAARAIVRFEVVDRDDDAGLISLTLAAASAGFSGAATILVTPRQLGHFADQLGNCYPLQADADLRFAAVHAPGIDRDPEVDVSVTRVDSRGGLAMRVHLAQHVPARSATNTRSSATIVVPVTYEQLRQLGVALTSVAQGESDATTLESRADF